MGKFIDGQHYSWTSELGPNERFGIEDEMSFQALALKLENEKKDNSERAKNLIEEPMKNEQKSETKVVNSKKSPEQGFFVDELLTKLKEYHKSREDAIALIRDIAERCKNITYIYTDELNEFLLYSEPAKKLLDYYIKNSK